MIIRNIRIAVKLAFANMYFAGLYGTAPAPVMVTSRKWSAL